MRKTISKISLFFIIGLGGVLWDSHTVEAKGLGDIASDVIMLQNPIKLDINNKSNIEQELFDKVQDEILLKSEILSVPRKLEKKVINISGESLYEFNDFKLSISFIDKNSKKFQKVRIAVNPANLVGSVINNLETLEKQKVSIRTFDVMIQLINTNPPTITTTNDEMTVYKGTQISIDTFGARAVDSNGKAIPVTLSSVDTNSTGIAEPVLSAIDEDKNKAEKSVKLKIIERPVYGSYEYIESEGNFSPINTSHRAAINGAEPGNCTWYVYNRLSQLGAPIPHVKMGNGKEWGRYARSYGYSVNKKVKAGKVAVFSHGTYGHVAFVEKVNSDGSILISEMNYPGLFNISKRTLSGSQVSQLEFIDFGL